MTAAEILDGAKECKLQRGCIGLLGTVVVVKSDRCGEEGPAKTLLHSPRMQQQTGLCFLQPEFEFGDGREWSCEKRLGLKIEP